jgi:hypothetical protein
MPVSGVGVSLQAARPSLAGRGDAGRVMLAGVPVNLTIRDIDQ